MQHAGFDSKVYGYQNSDVEDKSTGWVRSKHRASSFCDEDQTRGLVDGALLLHRKLLFGTFPNRDTLVSTSGDPLNPSFNFRPWLAYAPWLVVVAGIGWFLNRRSKLMKIRQSELNESTPEDAT